MKLTRAEEKLMSYLWTLEKAYLKNILDEYPEPKPAATTVATLLKRMADKGYVSFQQHGNNRHYFPLVKKSEYFSKHLKGLIKEFFNNSTAQFASFFTTETNLSEKDLKEIRKLVNKQIQYKSNKKR